MSNARRCKKGEFLGTSGFVAIHKMTDMDNNVVYADKIVPKSLVLNPQQKDNVRMEIEIHRSLSHAHIVGFHGFFEDKSNIYIISELCKNNSLLELHKRRKALTEPEV